VSAFRRTSLAVAAVVALLATSSAVVATQQAAPPAEPYPGSGLTRQQIMDQLTAAGAQSKPSVEQGKILFTALCSNCHVFGDLGQSLGPDLSTVGSRFGKRDVLESILWPSRTISDQYTMTVITLDDGTTENGLVAGENAEYVFLRTVARPTGRGVPILLSRIKDRKDATVSMMPEGLVSGLKLEQIDGIVAFMLTGK
jgi:putative heme-binding domain-containing protein